MRTLWSFLGNLLAVIISASILAVTAAGQDCPVSTVVHLVDKQMHPIVNITADQIKAEIKDTRANVVSIAPTKPAIILVLDASSSMKSTWEQSIGAARQVVAQAGDDISMFIFAEQIYAHAIGRAQSQDFLDRAAKQVPSGHHGTALYDTLIKIAGLAKNRSAAIVVISDGGDDMSLQSSDGTVSQFLHSAWPPVFGLILDHGHRERGYFKKITSATGELAIRPSSASNVPTSTTELMRIVLSSFTLELQPSQRIADMAKLKLQVIGAQGRPDKDISPLHVAEIVGCSTQGVVER